MKLVSVIKKYSRWNFFILSVLLLLAVSVFYYFYHSQRSGAKVYISALLVPSQSQLYSSNPFAGVPYWVDQAISVGDRELSPFGGVKATVLQKDSYETYNFGRVVELLLSVSAIKDRSGVYLFDNKPLAVGSVINLSLLRVETFGQVIYVGKIKPKPEKTKLVIHLIKKGVEKSIASNIQIGDCIYDNDKNVVAQIIDKHEFPSNIYNSVSYQQNISYGEEYRDIDVTVEIIVEKEYGTYYFARTQDVKVNEPIYLPFPDMSLSYTVTSLEEVKK
ncbi:hypothetical protein M1271_06570 [Patescibacteria group bacterium]|nr:hypothetical protein [Patescibacteria group bacterium]